MASILGKAENILISLDKAREFLIMEHAIDIIYSEKHTVRFSTKDAEGIDHHVSDEELRKLKTACENQGFHRIKIEM
jgi:Mn-dependent DtxR family transcriptional regulator